MTYSNGVATATTASRAWSDCWPVREDQRVAPAAYNGTVVVLTVPSTTTFTYAPASAPGGSATTQGTIGAVAQADITLPVKVISIESGNSKTVSYDSATGFLAEQHRQLRAGLTLIGSFKWLQLPQLHHRQPVVYCAGVDSLVTSRRPVRFETIASGNPQVRLGVGDQYVYMRRPDIRTR